MRMTMQNSEQRTANRELGRPRSLTVAARLGARLQSKFQNPNSKIAFTLVELIVVMIILLLLMGLIGLIGPSVFHSQKISNTKTTMANTLLAIDQFATLNPLRAVYDRSGKESFGSLPPYQLQAAANASPAAGSVGELLDAPLAGSYVLTNRLHRDIGNRNGNVNDWVRLNTSDAPNDDIRALGAYLSIYVPDAFAKIPESARKQLRPDEYVNRTGTGPAPGAADSKWQQVLGICDAWGVPLDYYVNIKLAWQIKPDGNMGWRVIERQPVLRSHGMAAEKVAAGQTDKQSWVLSENGDLPKPWFGQANANAVNATTGVISVTGEQYNGWVQARAAGESYSRYRPDQD